jgi:hypothetical protein
MIIAVAVSLGIRRVLSHENIYTIKLVSRRHFIPKALHANMLLVHQARDVMDRDILLLPTNMSFDAFLRQPKSEVIGRMWQRDAMMAIVVRGNGVALASDVLGVINKEHVADSVALSVGPYASIDGKA